MVLPYDVDALAYPGGGVLTMVGGELLDDGKMDEVGDCHHTWVHRDLRVRHNEVVAEDMNTLVEDHDAVAVHT